MAHTVQLSDGTNTYNLAVSATTGIKLLNLKPPRIARTEQRTEIVSGIYGARNTEDAFVEPMITGTFRIRGTSENDVGQQHLNITRMLNLVYLRERTGAGAIITLTMQRQGGTNAVTWRITGVDYPEAASDDLYWDAEALNFEYTFELGLRLEALGHATTPTTLLAATSFTNVTGSNVKTPAAAGGHSDSPLRVTMTRTAGTWSDVWVAQATGIRTWDPSGTVGSGGIVSDTAASNNQAQQFTINTTAPVVTGFTATASIAAYGPVMSFPARVFARLRVVSGTIANLRVRIKVALGNAGNSLQFALPWMSLSGVTGNYYTLLDLGESTHAARIADRAIASGSSVLYMLEMMSTDASSIVVNVDYMEAIFYAGLVKCSRLTIGTNVAIIYDDMMQVGGVTFPRPRPQMYLIDTTFGSLLDDAVMQGRLSFMPASVAWPIWCAVLSTGNAHTITDAGTIKIEQLPTYNGAIRGIN